MNDTTTEHLNTLLSGFGQEPPPTPKEIHVGRNNRAEVVDQMIAVLGKAPNVYQRDLSLVQIVTAADAGLCNTKVRRDDRQPVIVPITVDGLCLTLDRMVSFYRTRYAPNGGDALNGAPPMDCPDKHVRALNAATEWPGIKVLDAIVGSPTMRRDGSIVQRPGYDAASGLFLNIDSDWPRVHECPTREDALRALDILMEPFAEFPFSDEPSKAVFLSAALSQVARRAVPLHPIFFFVAPTAATGKTLLADCAAFIGTGVEPAKKSFPTDEDEMRKVLTTCLCAGDPNILFDNLKRGQKVQSPVLDSAVTSGWYKDRLLGKNENMALPFNLIVYVTGNNIFAVGDAVRRGLYCHLTPDVEHPEEREFKIPDLKAYIRKNRKRLAIAALTVLSAFDQAGRPKPERFKPFGSFEQWSNLIRAAVVWVGLADPLGSQEEMRADDDESGGLAELLDALVAVFGFERASPGDIKKRLDAVMEQQLGADTPESQLQDAVFTATGIRAPTAAQIGYMLKSQCARIVDGRQLVRTVDKGKKSHSYRVQPVGTKEKAE